MGGGVRKHLCDLLRIFSRPDENFSVHGIFAERGEPGLIAELDGFKAAGNFDYTILPTMQREVRPLADMRAYGQLKVILREVAPDIVHTHSSKAGILGRHAASNLGVKRIVHTPHVFAFQWADGLKGRVFLALERQAAKRCHSIVCVGEGQRADALARGVAEPEKLRVIRNGVAISAEDTGVRERTRRMLDLEDGTPAVGMVARLAPQKGVGVFLQAATRVIAQRPNVRFVIVGDGPLEDEMRARIAALKIGPRQIQLLGFRADAELLFAAFDVVALSSLYEGLPYVLLEAMARGIPVVATDVLGSRDVVLDGQTGYLAPLNDAEMIARRIVSLLDDATLRERMGQSARRRVATEFSFESFITQHRQLYRE